MGKKENVKTKEKKQLIFKKKRIVPIISIRILWNWECAKIKLEIQREKTKQIELNLQRSNKVI